MSDFTHYQSCVCSSKISFLLVRGKNLVFNGKNSVDKAKNRRNTLCHYIYLPIDIRLLFIIDISIISIIIMIKSINI